MKYLSFLIAFFCLLSASYASVFNDIAEIGDEPILATFSISIHVDRYDNAPVYQEFHQMTDLEQGFHLGKGESASGELGNINWREDLLFIKVTKVQRGADAETSISMLRYTDDGIQIKQLDHQMSDFSMAVAATP